MSVFKRAAFGLCAVLGLGWLGAALVPAQAATVLITADITASQTWTANNEYVLTKVIYVTSGATLTIEPGTVVRGEPSATPTSNDPGTLVITRGSKLIAQGTEDQPIIFTSMEDDNIGDNPGTFPYDTAPNVRGITGTWGGVILLGRGYVANNTLAGPSGSQEIQIEGLVTSSNGLYGNCAATALFPNDCDDDDSGVVQYTSIRYGGYNLSANNEINGLTLGAVGRSTDIDHVEVFQNKDDGMEMFGGAVGVKNVMLFSGGDDGLDYDEGWRGKAQFVFVVQGTPGNDKSDKGGEHDGGNVPDGSQPRAIPTVYNATYIGLGQKSTYTGRNLNTALHFRDNAGGRYYNSLMADFGGAAMLVEGTASSCKGAISSGERYEALYTPANPHYQQPDSDFELEFQDNTFWCIGQTNQIPGGRCSVTTTTTCCINADCPGGQTCVDQAPTYGGDTGKLHRGYDKIDVFTNSALDNDYLTCASPLPIRVLNRENSGAPSVPDHIKVIDPRPAAGALATDRVAPVDGFFENAPYRGAFANEDPPLATSPDAAFANRRWNWACWTNAARLGYMCDASTGIGAAPQEVLGLGYNTPGDKTRLSWLTCGRQVFDVLRVTGDIASQTASSFAGAACIETDDTNTFAVDANIPPVGDAHYYLVRAGNACGEGTLGWQSDGSPRVGTSCP